MKFRSFDVMGKMLSSTGIGGLGTVGSKKGWGTNQEMSTGVLPRLRESEFRRGCVNRRQNVLYDP